LTFGRTVLRTQTSDVGLNTSAILKVFCLSFYMTVGIFNHSGLHYALDSKIFVFCDRYMKVQNFEIMKIMKL
jgi:hypothetical protein